MAQRIVLLASEAAPFCKTGGLGDVAGALPHALARAGNEVHVVLPLYGSIDRARHRISPAGFDVSARMAGGDELLGVHRAAGSGPTFWFLAHHSFDRAGIYGPSGGEYQDNHLRFARWCRGALDLVKRVCPSPDIIHLHDWQAGLAAVELRAPGLPRDPSFERTRLVCTIHNLNYAGAFEHGALWELGLPGELWNSDALEFHGRLALLKGGLVYSDALTTVSPRYAMEIRTPAFGAGLDGLLRAKGEQLHGILNGIDTNEWDPSRDVHLPARYDAVDLSGKAHCRVALQRELGLHEDERATLFGVVSRLAWQKGIDLVDELIDGIVSHGHQVAVLGTGEPGIEERLAHAQGRHPGRVAVRLAFDDGLAHRIVAGSDAFLMPSRYEPCGLTQMYALRYGTVPVVRAVGGLDDTVVELDATRETGTGFKFGAATASALWAAVERTWQARERRDVWTALQRRGMSEDLSWDASAAAYERLFASLS